MKKRLLSMLLAVSLVAACIVGCAAQPGGEAAGTQQVPEQTKPVQADPVTIPKVVMYYALGVIPADQNMVAEKAKEYVLEKLGIELELQAASFSAYDSQLNMIVAGSEQVDLAVVWGASVSSFAAKGALYPMNNLIDQYGQGIQTSLGDYLNAGKIKGELYQVPVNRSMFYQGGVVLRRDILEKYNIDPAAISTEQDLDAIFAAIKAGEPDMAMIQPERVGGAFTYEDYDPLGDGYGVLMNYGQDLEVVNLYATEEFKATCQLHRDWYLKGYIPGDVLTNTEGAANLVRAGKLLGYYVTVGPGTEQDKTNQCGYDMVMVPLRQPYSYTSKVNGIGWSILNNTKDPASAMKVLDLMYSDPVFLNLLDWGIEGVHYRLKEGSEHIITFADGVDGATSGYFHNMSFEFGDQLSAYFWDGTEENFPEAVRAMNKSAIQSKAMGFAYDITPVKNEYTAVANVEGQYAAALSLGCIDPDANLPAFLTALEAAGIHAIIAEKQAQLDAWAAAGSIE